MSEPPVSEPPGLPRRSYEGKRVWHAWERRGKPGGSLMDTNDKMVAVADEYADAALALAEEHGVSDQFLAELGEFVSYMQSDETFANLMTTPVIDKVRRADLLDKAWRGRLNDLVMNTILVLNQKGRSGLVPLVHERFRLALERLRKEVDVHVTTAWPLTEQHRQRLGEMVLHYSGRKPRFVEKIDPAVIAGLKVQVEDNLLDDTALHHLQRMRQRFFTRGSEELHRG